MGRRCVCMILEGSYPYVQGGVSNWMHDYLRNDMDSDYVLWTIHAKRKEAGEFRYELSGNVKQVRQVCLEAAYEAKKGKRRRDRRSIRTIVGAFREILISDADAWSVLFEELAERRLLGDLFFSKEFLELAFEVSDCTPGLGLSEAFYGLRSMLLPIAHLLTDEIPEAFIYHSASAGYSGLLGVLGVALGIGGLVFVVLLVVSEIPVYQGLLLLLLFAVLCGCWILMSYISLIRAYRSVMLAYLAALILAVVGSMVWFLAGQCSVFTLLATLTVAYAMLDVLLFRSLSREFPFADSSFFAFFRSFRRYPALPLVGAASMAGMLGHFWVDRFCSKQATVISGLFRFDASYDFPAILAYLCTLPAMCYFITLFETDFEEVYSAYFQSLGGTGRRKELKEAHGWMLETLTSHLKILSLLQLSSCLFFVTVVAKWLAVLNIGMTTDMLYSFRLFCVGYSFYTIGMVLLLLQLYFMDDMAAAKTALLFAGASILGTRLSQNTPFAGLSFSIAALLLLLFSLAGLCACLMQPEAKVQLRQPIGRDAYLEFGEANYRRRRRLTKRQVRKRVAAVAIAIFCLGVVQIQFWQRVEKLVTFYPESTDEVLVSPGMGFAPWANSEETLLMDTSLVYVEIKWSDWEPMQGEYQIDWVKEEYHLETYRQEGRQVVLRFLMDEPTEETHMDIPEWLYEQMDGDGTWYDTSYGKGFSPNYENETLILAHAQAIAALGAAFGGDDLVCYVELGSLGHWGEWHTNLEEGLSGMPTANTRSRYVLPYLSAFPNAQLLLRYALTEVSAYGLGLYNDMTGDYDETIYWLEQTDGSLYYRWMGASEAEHIADSVLVVAGYQDNEILFIQKTEKATTLNIYYVSEEETLMLTALEEELFPQLAVSVEYAFVLDGRGVVYRYNLDDGDFETFCVIDLEEVEDPMLSVFDYRLMVYDLSREINDTYCYSLVADASFSEEEQLALEMQVASFAYETTAYEYQTLSMGSIGEEVWNLQEVLLALGYLEQQPTGIFGYETLLAVQYLQSDLGYVDTGVATGAFLTEVFALGTETALASPLLSVSSEGIYVRDVQARLFALNYLAKAPDGIMDMTTLAALSQFAADTGYTLDTVVSEELWMALYEEGRTALVLAETTTTETETTQEETSQVEGQVISDREVKVIRKWLTKQFAVNHTDKQAIKRLQKKLVKAGYLEEADVSMIYDQATYDAVARFQEELGLTVTGVATKSVLMNLFGTTGVTLVYEE